MESRKDIINPVFNKIKSMMKSLVRKEFTGLMNDTEIEIQSNIIDSVVPIYSSSKSFIRAQLEPANPGITDGQIKSFSISYTKMYDI